MSRAWLVSPPLRVQSLSGTARDSSICGASAAQILDRGQCACSSVDGVCVCVVGCVVCVVVVEFGVDLGS